LSVGTGVYAAASLGRGSYEALTFSLAEKNGWQVKAVRMILDIVMVLTGSFAWGKVWHMYNRNDHYLRTGYSVYSIKN